MPDTADFKTEGFLPEMRAWMLREQPSDELLALVAEWEPALVADPFNADDDGDNMLFRTVPGTKHGDWVVTLSYAIEYGQKRICCASFCCRRLPVGSEPPPWPPEPHEH